MLRGQAARLHICGHQRQSAADDIRCVQNAGADHIADVVGRTEGTATVPDSGEAVIQIVGCMLGGSHHHSHPVMQLVLADFAEHGQVRVHVDKAGEKGLAFTVYCISGCSTVGGHGLDQAIFNLDHTALAGYAAAQFGDKAAIFQEHIYPSCISV